MDDPRLFDGGEICLYDLAPERAGVIKAFLERTPEYAKTNVKVTYNLSLEESLEGADAVGIIMPAGSQASAIRSSDVARKHNFIASDNVSPTGAMHGIKAGPIIMNVARKMETHCPNAYLIDFVNPVAVFSGMVNNHTKIKALGVCAGYTNHQWDIARLLGTDQQLTHVNVEAAGINHLSFILRGTLDGKDIFELIDKALEADWTMPKLLPRWGGGEGIINSVTQLARIYRQLGVLIFSTEGDGMEHLFYDRAVKNGQARHKSLTEEEVAQAVANSRAARKREDAEFAAYLDQDLDQKFWDDAKLLGNKFEKADDDIFIKVLRGIAGLEHAEIVTSRLNEGNVVGFDDRTVIEYSQTLYKDTVTGRGNLFIPPVVQGMISGLAAHQTMLGDAIATEDPKLLAHALLAYPWMPYSEASKQMHRELIEVNGEEVPPALRAAVQYLV
jgi:6-phospho-beta-glucosidase